MAVRRVPSASTATATAGGPRRGERRHRAVPTGLATICGSHEWTLADRAAIIQWRCRGCSRSKRTAGRVDGRADGGAAVQLEQVPPDHVLDLRVGEIVEVRSEAEILATLDERAETMTPLHARDAAVLRPTVPGGQAGREAMRHHQLDRHVPHAQRRASGRGAVGGEAGGSCRPAASSTGRRRGLSGCLRAPPSRPARRPSPRPHAHDVDGGDLQGPRRSPPDEELFSCQATELLRAAPERVPPWDVSQYVLDVRSGNAGLFATVRAIAIGVFNGYQDYSPEIPAEVVADSGRHAAAVHRGETQERPQTTRSTCSPGSSSGSGARKRSSGRLT